MVPVQQLSGPMPEQEVIIFEVLGIFRPIYVAIVVGELLCDL